MEKEIKKRTEKEIEIQKDDDSAGKSEVSPPAIKHDLPIPSYQVGYQAINTISEKKNIIYNINILYLQNISFCLLSTNPIFLTCNAKALSWYAMLCKAFLNDFHTIEPKVITSSLQ